MKNKKAKVSKVVKSSKSYGASTIVIVIVLLTALVSLIWFFQQGRQMEGLALFNQAKFSSVDECLNNPGLLLFRSGAQACIGNTPYVCKCKQASGGECIAVQPIRLSQSMKDRRGAVYPGCCINPNGYDADPVCLAQVGQPPASTPAPSCTDGVKNGAETDVDCGGNCPVCATGKQCNVNSDCTSGSCAGGVCAAPVTPTCTDGVKNGAETDVDCGGNCPACVQGKVCQTLTDCTTGKCSSGICCVSNEGTACNRNSCGGSGVVRCDGSCSASAPYCPSATSQCTTIQGDNQWMYYPLSGSPTYVQDALSNMNLYINERSPLLRTYLYAANDVDASTAFEIDNYAQILLNNELIETVQPGNNWFYAFQCVVPNSNPGAYNWPVCQAWFPNAASPGSYYSTNPRLSPYVYQTGSSGTWVDRFYFSNLQCQRNSQIGFYLRCAPGRLGTIHLKKGSNILVIQQHGGGTIKYVSGTTPLSQVPGVVMASENKLTCNPVTSCCSTQGKLSPVGESCQANNGRGTCDNRGNCVVSGQPCP